MKWISVKDRLPEEGLSVWVFIKAGDSPYILVSKQWQNGDVWTDVDSYDEATHWMPLPNAPDKDAHFEGCVTLMHLCDNWPLREICEDGINCTKHPDYEILYKCVDNCPLKDTVLERAARIMEKHKETFEKLSKE